HHNDIVGSVAGDDTILLVIKDAEFAAELTDDLNRTFGKT
ncbi:MAG: ArgR family transcriptional regulator, partial [Clostridia bacterium]|nr:ArgR family transcriptional regulator [Clostridia bacterium]